MRRFVILFAVAAMVVMASPASAARLRAYRGETSAGTKIAFRIRVADDGAMSMQWLYLRVELPCEDGSRVEYDSYWSFGGGEPLHGRRLVWDSVYQWEALHITGTFRGQTADGTYEHTEASLTDTEEAQLCTSGDLSWTAERVHRDRLDGLGSPKGTDVVHRVTDGEVRSVSRSG